MEDRARILVVDDDAMVLQVLHDTLAPYYDVEIAHSGHEALAKLAGGEFAVLLADQRMPGLTGVELVARAKLDQPHLVAVLLSGYTDPSAMIAAINRAQIFRFVPKPWDIADLLLTLEHAAERHRLSRDNARLVVELKRRLHAVEILHDVFGAAALSHGEHPADVLIDRLESVLDYDLAAVLVSDEIAAPSLKLRGRGRVAAAHAADLRDQMCDLLALAGGRPPPEATIRFSMTAQLDPDHAPTPVLSQLQVPLKQGEKVVGVMAVQAFRADAFAPDAAQLLDLLANGTAAALDRMRAAGGHEQARIEEVLAALPEGVLVMDAAGEVLLVNATARQLCEPEGLLGPRLLEVFGTSLEEALGAAPAVRDATLAGRRVAPTLRRIAVGSERRAAVMIVMHDVSAVEQAELNRRDYFATLAHEIRTPLTSLTATLDLLLHGTVGRLTAKQREYVELADQASTSLNQLVDSLLDLEKSVHGGLSLNIRPARLDAIVHQVVARFMPMAKDRELDLTVAAVRRMRPIPIDALRIEQVVANLLSNAAKFAPSRSQVQVTVTATDAVPGYAVLGVQNHGEAVEPAELAAIFERFRQGRRGPEVGLRGTGLGLAICRAIAEAHGGAVLAESDAIATRFWVALPSEPRPATRAGGEVPLWIACEGLAEADAVALAAMFVYEGLRVHLLPREAARATAARAVLGAGVVIAAAPLFSPQPCVEVDVRRPEEIARLASALARLEGERADLHGLPRLAPGVAAVLRALGWPVPASGEAEPAETVAAAALVDLAQWLTPGEQARAPLRAFYQQARAAGAACFGVARLQHLDAFRAAYGARQAGALQAAFAAEMAGVAAGQAVPVVMVEAGAALAGASQDVAETLSALARQMTPLARLYYRRDDRERGCVRLGANEVPLVDVSVRTLPGDSGESELLAAVGL